ncbi:ethanolamine ammonia-lyase reactivating factor EutA [Halobacillus yeomjeoni]|uniref:Ethanolamine ammonia-lyase reactivating factor EutA n=1 Tax=Halobacillus yeomjeoni TaxID=311194 RepID=A0A931HUE6_9BACI|nr:ethanolamine ammonia-lyase reactivating factor EutA [Halobacillus yeomjeoni]MBH0229720.1 ethanolamine ammonia-lyase reactivating factor EutA [Halobacillus yeomjeoni]
MSVRDSEEIYSAGIDIGTSTTKIVISKFTLRNTASQVHMPRVEITDKKIIHKSPIFRTPLVSGNQIDMDGVERIVLSQYDEAGVRPKDIQTGAVIITGETATKKNAQQVIGHLSDHAGEFLVATAGPDLESIIAAKGSGAFELSKNTSRTVANIDIGGGTANIAVYRYGKLLGTCTLHVGGKLIEFVNGRVSYISPEIKKVCKKLSVSVNEGEELEEELSRKLTDYMANTINEMLTGQLKENEPLLLGHLPEWEKDIDVLMFSGGVSHCIYHAEECNLNHLYDDIGVRLAESIKEHRGLQSMEWKQPYETVRATVLGAGTQTTEISGATIQVDGGSLPLRNLPVFTLHFSEGFDEVLKEVTGWMEEALQVYDPHREGVNFALYLSDLPLLGFHDLQRLADTLVQAAQKKPVAQPLIVVIERDLAKSLGQAIRSSHPGQETVCIDQIKVEQGDYLDIGKTLRSGVVPVVIKTLTFQ